MNFAELRFWNLLIAGLTVILLLRPLCLRWVGIKPTDYDRASLAVLSLGLLTAVSWQTLLIFLLVAFETYYLLKFLLRFPQASRARFLLVLIPLQLAPLLYYKYANFALNGICGLGVDWASHLLIPVGISFYTFQIVSFAVDTLAFRRPMPGLLDFLNFASFFPQIVAGPIERREHLLPQMQQFRYVWQRENLDQGIPWIIAGLFYKCCLADNLAKFFGPQSSTNPYSIWLANVLFGLRIYYDFAGYSLVAVGLARCLGLRLTLNFTSPYCSTNITEFWRRWHITLSQWFKDYVYVPLGGGRIRWWAVNVMIVFVVSGIWHGAGWNFILWGVLHGIYLVFNRLLGPKLRLPAFPAWLLTMYASFLAWLCFYETRTGVLQEKLVTLFTPAAYRSSALREALACWKSPDGLVLCCFLAIAGVVTWAEWQSLVRHKEPYYYLRTPRTAGLLLILTIALAAGNSNAFIYFAF